MDIKKVTKKSFEEYLNRMGIPSYERESNMGRIPTHSKYGTWLRRNDPTAFSILYNEFSLKIPIKRGK